MRTKVKLERVWYLENRSDPVFLGYYQGTKITGNKEQLISSLAKLIALEPKPTSKKARIIPGTEKLSYKGKIVKCIKTTRYFDFFDQRNEWKYEEVDFDKEFPLDYLKRSTKEIDIEVEVEITELKWDFKTTRKRMPVLN